MVNLYATKTEPTYENFIAVCPHCNYENVYNRVSDLKTREPIDFKEVVCLNENCRRAFNINGDLVAPAYTYLVLDCYKLKRDKRYMYCILNIAQAYEAFFGLYLRVELLYKPFGRSRSLELARLNELAAALDRRIRTYTYRPLRNIFLNRVLRENPINLLDESESIIEGLDGLRDDPSDQAIDGATDRKLAPLLKKLKDSDIGEARNMVVHKYAYRPSLEQAEYFIEEARDILFSLDAIIGPLYDDVQWYYQTRG